MVGDVLPQPLAWWDAVCAMGHANALQVGQGVRTAERQCFVLVCERETWCKDESLCYKSLLRDFLKSWG